MQTFLKCDTEDCGWIEYHEDIDEDMVDKPCPLCKSNLLEYNDFVVFKNAQGMISLSKTIQMLYGEPSPGVQKGRVIISAKSGVLNIQVEKIPKE